MPGGLNEVVQPVGADTSRYIAEYRAALSVTKELSAANKDLMRTVAETQNAIKSAGGGGGTAGADSIAKTNAAIRDQLKLLGDHSSVIQSATSSGAAFSSVQEQIAKIVRDSGDAARETTLAMSDLAVSHEKVRAVSTDGGSAIRSYASDLGSLKSAVSGTRGAIDDASRSIDVLTAKASGAGPATTNILGPALAAAMTQAQGQASPWPASAAVVAAMAARGGGGGGGSGGGGGGGGGGIGPFLSRAGDPGTAGYDANLVAGFVKRWWTAAHWTMMATNEVLATVGPAAAAAGAAALVGLQGAQQMVNRYNAIDSTAEAFGGAYGITTGSFLGAGSALQKYQNLATGGVYELGGAGINIAKSGGGAFGQLGLSTIAMVDRGVANMQNNMQANGTMSELAGLGGKGTGYLQQFGDIGANLGDIFLGLAPNLPGVGGDYLSALQGGTHGIASVIQFMNRSGLGSVLGMGLAGEAGVRVGKPLVGLAGKGLEGLGGLLGKIPGLGAAGLNTADIAGVSDLTGVDLGTGALGLGGEGLAGLLSGAGTGLGALASPELAVLAAAAYGISKIGPPASVAKMGALQAGINSAGFSGAWQPLGKAVTTATGLSALPPGSGLSTYGDALSNYGAGQTGLTEGRFGTIGQTNSQVYASAATSFANQMGELVDSGPQLQAALKKAGLKGASLADSFQIAQNALLDLPHAFGKNGKLTQQAKTMLDNYVSAIAPMTQNAGAFGSAVAGQTIMGSSAMQNLSKVNSAMDSMTQIMSGTPLGASGLAASVGAISAPAIAKALTSVTSAGSGAAWNAFASTSTSTPGIITQLQQFNDQMRTGLTLGAIGPGQAAGMTGYELKQALPMAKSSPAALAMLMQQGAQQGIGGYYNQGESQAQNYAAFQKAVSKAADSTKQMNADSTSMTIKLANLPQIAKQFAQGTGADIQSQQMAKAATDAMSIKSGVNVKVNSADLISQLKAAGVQGAAALKSTLDSVLSQAGVGKAERIKIEAQVQGVSQVQQLKNEIAQLHDKEVTAKAHGDSSEVRALNAQIAALHDKLITITTDIVTVRMTSANNPYAGGISGRAGMATGMRIPGFGGGDIFPAMLEPGEAVVPKHLTAAVAPFLAAHGVPGFASGMIPAGTLSGVNAQISGQWKSLDQLYASHAAKAQIDAFWKTVLDPLYAAKDKLTATTTAVSASTSTALGKLAATLGGQFTTEMNYARSVAGAAAAGQGYGTQGLISGFTATAGPSGVGAAPPGTRGYNAAAWNAAVSNAATDTPPAQTVQQQMQSYLGTVQSFTKDLHTLTKDGLSKSLISQLVAAGPTQGDALAQSILGGAGGVKGANSLWAQIGKASNAFGAQAGMSMYGGIISPNLKSATVTNNNISVNVSVPGGAAGDLPLTNAQIKTLTEEIQAKLLQQARRNQRTGVQLRGRGA